MPHRPEPLFWLARDDNGKRTVFLQHASEKTYAWLRSGLAGYKSKPVEIHVLDDKMARKISPKLIGRVLTEPRGAWVTGTARIVLHLEKPRRLVAIGMALVGLVALVIRITGLVIKALRIQRETDGRLTVPGTC